MFACGTKKVHNGDKLLDQIRSLSGMSLGIRLNEYKLDFNEQTGDWKNNLNDRPIFDENVEKRKEEIEKLREESKSLDTEISTVEKEYLAKIAKLLLMAQVHCELKADINDVFDELGLDDNQEEENENEDHNDHVHELEDDIKSKSDTSSSRELSNKSKSKSTSKD